MDALARLQSWYMAQCDGDWEHTFGVSIGTLDNPGWSLSINLKGTPEEGCIVERLRLERSENDWIHVWKADLKLEGACGPENLVELLEHCLTILGA